MSAGTYYKQLHSCVDRPVESAVAVGRIEAGLRIGPNGVVDQATTPIRHLNTTAEQSKKQIGWVLRARLLMQRPRYREL